MPAGCYTLARLLQGQPGMNQQTPKRTHPVPVRLDNELLAGLKQRAEKEKTTVAGIIRAAIRKFLGLGG